MSRRTKRLAAALVGFATAVAVTTACDPPWYPTFEVTSPAFEPDATVGDGFCATSAGVCTLRAAVDEGNAAGGAVIRLGDGSYEGDDLYIDGDITISPAGTSSLVVNHDFRVREGATLRLSRVHNWGYDNIIEVNGTLVADHISRVNDGVAVKVNPTGVALISNSVLIAFNGDQFLYDRGAVAVGTGKAVVLQSTLIGRNVHALSSQPGSSVTLTGNILQRTQQSGPAGPVCVGSGRTSGGTNIANDGSCTLSAAGDRQNLDPMVTIIQVDRRSIGTLEPGSPAIDSGGTQTVPCPNGSQPDVRGVGRPVDGNGDGVAICDIGSFEYP